MSKGKGFRFNPEEGYSGFTETDRSDSIATYNGPVLTDFILREMEVWARILPPLFEGVKKPHSTIYELQRIERLERDKKIDLSELKQTLKNCCPPESTVSDSIDFKNFREAIIERLIEISGISGYMK